jgi:ClpP class serine protease
MPNWSDVLQEINQVAQQNQIAAIQKQQQARQALDQVRRRYLLELHQYTSRNVIAYYSGFLSKPELRSDINDEDKNGFMMAVHRLPRMRGLDLIIHTPGGSIASTQLLRSRS